jgi:hypothetical protein
MTDAIVSFFFFLFLAIFLCALMANVKVPIYNIGSQIFSGYRSLGFINSSPVPHALPYKKHSSEQLFAHPIKEDRVPH